jgi:hypothetical protein
LGPLLLGRRQFIRVARGVILGGTRGLVLTLLVSVLVSVVPTDEIETWPNEVGLHHPGAMPLLGTVHSCFQSTKFHCGMIGAAA